MHAETFWQREASPFVTIPVLLLFGASVLAACALIAGA